MNVSNNIGSNPNNSINLSALANERKLEQLKKRMGFIRDIKFLNNELDKIRAVQKKQSKQIKVFYEKEKGKELIRNMILFFLEYKKTRPIHSSMYS